MSVTIVKVQCSYAMHVCWSLFCMGSQIMRTSLIEEYMGEERPNGITTIEHNIACGNDTSMPDVKLGYVGSGNCASSDIF